MSREVNFGKLLHGGDYNPEQWLHDPDILEKDIESHTYVNDEQTTFKKGKD